MTARRTNGQRTTSMRAFAWCGRPARLVVAAAVLLCTSLVGCRREATVEHDLSTPRSAAIVFTRALEAGDAETAKSAAYAGGVEVEWVEGMARATSGMRQLVAAAEAKFGPEAQNLVSAKNALRMSGGLASAEVQLNGERATVVPANDTVKIPMKQVDGNWKIDVGALTRGEDLTFVTRQLRALGAVAPQMTKDVEAGKFTSVRDIQRAMAQAVVETMFRPGTTAPSTTAPASPAAAPPPAPASS